jgi:hypothetical protein
MVEKLNDVVFKNKTFKIDIEKSTMEDLQKDGGWNACFESSISGKALLRIVNKDHDNIFYNPNKGFYDGHVYDFDNKLDYENFIKNNSNKSQKDCNEYFICIYLDIEFDEISKKVADIYLGEINKTTRIVLENAVIE